MFLFIYLSLLSFRANKISSYFLRIEQQQHQQQQQQQQIKPKLKKPSERQI